MTRDAKPTLKALLLEAVERALDGGWQAAHRIVQDHDDDAVAGWIHAVGTGWRVTSGTRNTGTAAADARSAKMSRRTRSSEKSRPSC